MAYHQPDRPFWLDRRESVIAELTDEQLAEFIAYWHDQREGYRRLREEVTAEHPDAHRWGYSSWWGSKYESMGIREAKRRRIERT